MVDYGEGDDDNDKRAVAVISSNDSIAKRPSMSKRCLQKCS